MLGEIYENNTITGKNESHARITKKVTEANEDYLDFWLKNTLFHWDFFLSLFFTVIPLLIWIKFRKKESTARLLFAGFFVMIDSSLLDFLGVAFGKWYYTGKVIPTIPSYIPWDFVLIPRRGSNG